MRKIIKCIFFIGFLVTPFINCISDQNLLATEPVSCKKDLSTAPFALDQDDNLQSSCLSPAGVYNEDATDDCMPHSDSEYQKLIVGTWSLNNSSLVDNKYSLTIQYGATGMLTLTMYDINNELYNSAYGYFDIKHNQIAATFYNESNNSVGLANGNPFYVELVCANSLRHIVRFHGTEFIFNKLP